MTIRDITAKRIFIAVLVMLAIASIAGNLNLKQVMHICIYLALFLLIILIIQFIVFLLFRRRVYASFAKYGISSETASSIYADNADYVNKLAGYGVSTNNIVDTLYVVINVALEHKSNNAIILVSKVMHILNVSFSNIILEPMSDINKMLYVVGYVMGITKFSHSEFCKVNSIYIDPQVIYLSVFILNFRVNGVELYDKLQNFKEFESFNIGIFDAEKFIKEYESEDFKFIVTRENHVEEINIPMPQDISDNYQDETNKTVSGLDGWLILVGIGLFIGPPYILIQLYIAFKRINMLSIQQWYQIALDLNIGFIAIISMLLILFVLFICNLNLICLFLMKKKAFPITFVWVLLFNFNIIFILNIYFNYIELMPSIVDGALIGSLLGCAIWIPYMYLSKRVKATFIN